jgi:mRNA interferase RelE/StbE
VSGYRIEITARAQREIASIARGNRRRAVAIRDAILALAQDPRPGRCRKLTGPHDLYRIRVAAYRIVYRVADGAVTITVVRVAHRGDVYTDLDHL